MTRKHLSQADKQLLAKAKAELVNPERAFRTGHKDDLRGEVLIARYRGHCRRSEKPIAEGSDVRGHGDYDGWVCAITANHRTTIAPPAGRPGWAQATRAATIGTGRRSASATSGPTPSASGRGVGDRCTPWTTSSRWPSAGIATAG